MAIFTKPIFYYVEAIGLNNRFLDFNEGIGELTAELDPSGYAPEELATQVARQFNLTGTQFYTVSFDRDTRLYTISAPSNFDLLITGTNAGLSAYETLGFAGDKTGANTYTSDVAIGSEYTPQFPLQQFRGFEDSEEGIDASINESASGLIEIVTFGRRRFMEFNIKYIKDGQPCSDSIYGDDPNAVQNARDFLSFCIGKGRLEFMKDEEDRLTFDTILLESTQRSSKGVSYRLNELYNENLIGYYETGRLEFRKIE